ncbi:hypothetical protein O9929_06190 [Vibrio lentus]|nr:hypothetical protein [Vibrio lentus]
MNSAHHMLLKCLRTWIIAIPAKLRHTSGMKVYTTVDSKLQKAAQQATIKNAATMNVTFPVGLKRNIVAN